MLIPTTAGPIPSGRDTGGPEGIRGRWLMVTGIAMGKPLSVGMGADGNRFKTSGLMAGTPLCTQGQEGKAGQVLKC